MNLLGNKMVVVMGRRTVKKVSVFPSPDGMSPTKLPLSGNNLIRESLVSDVLAEEGKISNLFFTVCTYTKPNLILQQTYCQLFK
jgi:hypothetical protein